MTTDSIETEGPFILRLLARNREERVDVRDRLLKPGYMRSVEPGFDFDALGFYPHRTAVLVAERQIVGSQDTRIIGTVAMEWADSWEAFGRLLGDSLPRLRELQVPFVEPTLIAARAAIAPEEQGKNLYLAFRAAILEWAMVSGAQMQAGLNLTVSRIPERLRTYLGYETFPLSDDDAPTAPLKGPKEVNVLERRHFERVLAQLPVLRAKPPEEGGGFPEHRWLLGSAEATHAEWERAGHQFWLNPLPG